MIVSGFGTSFPRQRQIGFPNLFAGLFCELIWKPLLDDKEGESSGDTILSCFVFDSLELFRCLVVEEIVDGLGLFPNVPCKIDSCMPDNGGRWLREKLESCDVVWDPTLRTGR